MWDRRRVPWCVLRLGLRLAPRCYSIGRSCRTMVPLKMRVGYSMPMHHRFRRTARTRRRRRRRHSRRVTIQCVGGLVWRLFKEIVLQCVVWRHTWLGVVLEHTSHNVFEAQIVGNQVTGLIKTSATRTTSLYTEYVAQSPTSWRLVLSSTITDHHWLKPHWHPNCVNEITN